MKQHTSYCPLCYAEMKQEGEACLCTVYCSVCDLRISIVNGNGYELLSKIAAQAGHLKLLEEQCRVGDAATHHLFTVAKQTGKPLPDWAVKELPNLYRLLERIKELEEELKNTRG